VRALLDTNVPREALALGLPDYEDAVLQEAARHSKAQGIVTRDQQGFKRSELPVYTPDELLATLRHRR
jgi:predicted nucleic acid-binding protein